MSPAELLSAIQSRFADIREIGKIAGQVRGPELQISVSAAQWLGVARHLKDDPQLYFDSLCFLTSVDWKTHFEIVCFLRSTLHGHLLAVKIRLDNKSAPEAPSVASIWPAANWQEREEFDLMGIVFTGHPELRRLLLPENWSGHPLRKDYVARPDRYD
ncbi:MAG TPA: NADH-quinone oxidoreductase subunit C [Elusimicrobiota bacterium]|nr:NADH-quinone oxidoreductase subunit C [Elusimicrobiota bacterium]